MWEDATSNCASYLPPKLAENLKTFPINFSKGAKYMSYIRFMFYIRPLKILQHTFRCLQTNACHAAIKSSEPGSVIDVLDLIEKCDCFLICFQKIVRFLSNIRSYNNIWTIRKMFLKLHTNFAEKNRVLLCSVNVWIGTHVLAIPKWGRLFLCCVKFTVRSYTTSDMSQRELLRAVDRKYNSYDADVVSPV